MAKYKRMINCDFVNASSFKMKISNKAKLLYFYIMANSDDKGFCDNADEIAEILNSNDRNFHNEASLDLIKEDFVDALAELVQKNLVKKFNDKYGNPIYLVRHWYRHNQIPRDRVRASLYDKYLKNYFVNNEGEYQLLSRCVADATQLPTQNKINKSKVNKNTTLSKEVVNTNNSNVEEVTTLNDSLDNVDSNYNDIEQEEDDKLPF